MAPIEKKRKDAPTNESFARSRKSNDGDDRPTKRLRPDEKEGKAAKIPHVPKISKIREEDVPFPRGGASVLTPLEHKQIQIEATRDVLFEQQSGKPSEVGLDGEDDEAIQPSKNKIKSKSKGKGKGKSKIGQESATVEEDVIKIQGLSYTRIVQGSLALGQVSQINAHDIALSLPNNLTGYVPVTSISDRVTQRIEAIAAAVENNAEEPGGSDDDDDDDDDDVDLKTMFSVGQYLRAFVVSTSEDAASSGKSKRRIELSLRPQLSNGSIGVQNVIVHNTLMASVISVEDHGLIMDLGLADSEMRGFMSSKEIGHGIKLSDIQEGAVFLCMVVGLSSNGKIVKLSADTQKIANPKKLNHLSEAPTIDAFLPGTAVEILVADITARGIAGKIMGILDVTADLVHSGAGSSGNDLEKKYKIGSRINGRVICSFPAADPPKLGVSLLDHVLSLASQQAIRNGERLNPLEILPLSTIIEDIVIRKVVPEVGLFVDIGVKGVSGFVHISRVKDGKIETLSETSGAYKTGTSHRGRLVGYNSLDGLYLVSLESTVLEQPFLRIEDLKVGEVVKGAIEKIVINTTGVGGLLINLAEGITGFVPEAHMADAQLQHPEKIFKEGKSVTARVLSTNSSKRQVRLTLKKSLVNSEAAPFISYEDIRVGGQSPGTIVNILPTGAVVQFYADVRGFLPVSEMSEAFIQDPSQHFRVGQVVNVHVLKVDSEAKKLTVSCKDASASRLEQQVALKKLKVGEIVSALVTEKSSADISVEIQPLGLRAVLPIGHLTDRSGSKNLSAFKKIRVGQILTDLAVLEKLEQKRLVVLTNKLSLVNSAKDRTLLRSFEDIRENKIVHGFVKNLTLTAVFVQFGGGLTGLLPRNKLSEDAIRLPDFGMTKLQSIKVKINSVDHGLRRFVLSLVDGDERDTLQQSTVALVGGDNQLAINPIDSGITFLEDLTLGKLTKAKVISVKETQINVKLADNIQGRIDVSQIFNSWDEIKDRKRPLRTFSAKDNIIDVRILGIHDARNHRFLPITHRTGKTLVFELSAKEDDQKASALQPLTLDKVEIGSSWIAFLNNIGDDCVWVNLSPNVRGRIQILNLSDDVSLLKDVESNFPIGSAIKVRVTSVDSANNRLELSARSTHTEVLTFENLSKGMVVAGKVTRVNERQIMVQLSNSISAPVNLTELADDFSNADTSKYSKNDIVRVCITELDTPNKRIILSTRPSRVLNSSLTVQDTEISSASQVKVNDIVRGFVNNVSDKGLFVNLGGSIKAYVRVSDLSDSYIKDWKSDFQIGQLVKGKVIAVDETSNHIQLSLKASVIDKNYVPLLTFDDIKVRQVITGKIRKVEDFGVFIVVDGSKNVSGLCHQSEMAEKRVHDVKKLYEEGDSVKAIVLKIDPEKRRISFGLKASYFDEGSEPEGESDDEEGMQGVRLGPLGDEEDESEEEVESINLDCVESIGSIEERGTDQPFDEGMEDVGGTDITTLDGGGFDWSAKILDEVDEHSDAETEESADAKPNKKKQRKSDIKIDQTGDLDKYGPQSISDFERLLLGQPNSSDLWNRYMLFQAQLGEIIKARETAERAIKTINAREETEKLNAWIALLVLEVAHGSDESVEEAFKRACQYNDAQEIHESLASIYIKTGKYQKADELFQTTVKKFSQSPKIWENYSHFLHTVLSSPDRARTLLPRAIQSLPSSAHLPLTLKFASLEFKSANGSPERGRTMFEGILSTYPKRLDLWNQLLDLEIQQGDKDTIRNLFETLIKTKGVKERGALAWFKRWGKWEDENGDKKSQEKVRAKAEEWVTGEKARRDALKK